MLIGIPIYCGVDLLDVTGSHEMFSWTDLDVQLFAQEAGLVTCRSGLSIYAATRFENAPAFDVLWVPGGGPDALARFGREAVRGTLDTSRYRMPYFSWGEGPPLLFIHGVSDSSRSFLLPIARRILSDVDTARDDHQTGTVGSGPHGTEPDRWRCELGRRRGLRGLEDAGVVGDDGEAVDDLDRLLVFVRGH